ncbi:MAG: hypothetical protein ACREDR_22445 [Blastocatellia bacterium]
MDRTNSVEKSSADVTERVLSGKLLGSQGNQLKKGLYEVCVYLGPDGFVYEVWGEKSKGGLKAKIKSKRAVGDYLRWVDGLFRPGELPGESSAVHYRAARLLRELM